MRIRWAASILFLLVGCVKVPEHDLAVEAESSGCETVAIEAVDTGEFKMGDWPSEAWWKEFNDPVLTALIEEGLKSNPNLKKAQASLDAAAQIALQKKAALFPELSFDPADTWQHYSKTGFFRTYAPDIPPNVNDIIINLTFTYEFDFWGKYRDLFKAALGEASAKYAEKKQAELMVATTIAYTYQELQFLLLKQQIYEKQEAIRNEALNIRAKRELHAIDTAMIHLGSKSDKLDVSASLRQVDPLIRQHLNMLKTLAGMTQDEVLDVPPKPLNPLQTAIPEHLSLDLIARRPDLTALKARVEAAAKEIDAAKTDFYPNLNLTALVGIETIFWSKIFNINSYSGSLQPAIHLPIFTAGRLRAQLMEKVADFNEAVFAYNAAILQAAQDIADTLTEMIFLQKEIEIRLESLEIAHIQEQLSRKRLEHALDDRITLLETQYMVLDLELLVASLEYGKQLEAILLIRGLGGGYRDCP